MKYSQCLTYESLKMRDLWQRILEEGTLRHSRQNPHWRETLRLRSVLQRLQRPARAEEASNDAQPLGSVCAHPRHRPRDHSSPQQYSGGQQPAGGDYQDHRGAAAPVTDDANPTAKQPRDLKHRQLAQHARAQGAAEHQRRRPNHPATGGGTRAAQPSHHPTAALRGLSPAVH